MKRFIRAILVTLFMGMIMCGSAWADIERNPKFPEGYTWNKGDMGRNGVETISDALIIKSEDEYYFIDPSKGYEIFKMDKEFNISPVYQEGNKSNRPKYVTNNLNKVGDFIFFSEGFHDEGISMHWKDEVKILNTKTGKITSTGIINIKDMFVYEKWLVGIIDDRVVRYDVTNGDYETLTGSMGMSKYSIDGPGAKLDFPKILGVEDGKVYVYSSSQVRSIDIESKKRRSIDEVEKNEENYYIPKIFHNGELYYKRVVRKGEYEDYYKRSDSAICYRDEDGKMKVILEGIRHFGACINPEGELVFSVSINMRGFSDDIEERSFYKWLSKDNKKKIISMIDKNENYMRSKYSAYSTSPIMYFVIKDNKPYVDRVLSAANRGYLKDYAYVGDKIVSFQSDYKTELIRYNVKEKKKDVVYEETPMEETLLDPKDKVANMYKDAEYNKLVQIGKDRRLISIDGSKMNQTHLMEGRKVTPIDMDFLKGGRAVSENQYIVNKLHMKKELELYNMETNEHTILKKDFDSNDFILKDGKVYYYKGRIKRNTLEVRKDYDSWAKEKRENEKLCSIDILTGEEEVIKDMDVKKNMDWIFEKIKHCLRYHQIEDQVYVVEGYPINSMVKYDMKNKKSKKLFSEENMIERVPAIGDNIYYVIRNIGMRID